MLQIFRLCSTVWCCCRPLKKKRHDLCHGKVKLHGACQEKVINISMAGIYEDTCFMISII